MTHTLQARDGSITISACKSLDLSTAFVVLEVNAPRNVVTLTLEQAMAAHKALGEAIDLAATMIALKEAVGRSAA